MATNNKQSVTEAVEPKVIDSGSIATEKPKKSKVKPEDKQKPVETAYTVEELASAAKTFDSDYALVKTALKLAGKDRATVTEAKDIIEKFKNKEVK